MRAVTAGDGVTGAVERCNDGTVAAVFDEFNACVDFGPHRTFEEVAAGREFLDFVEADLFDVFLVGLAVVEFGVVDVGEDEEDVGVDELGEFGAGEVFVDDGCGAVEAVFVAHDGDAAAARSDDDAAAVDQFADDVDFGVIDGDGAGNDAAEALFDRFGLDLFDDPVGLFRGECFGFGFGKEGTDGLGGILKAGVICRNDVLIDDGDDGDMQAFFGEDVFERLFKHVAELSLGHGADDVEWHVGNHRFAFFLLNEEVADLWPVAVRDDEFVTGFDEFDELAAGFVNVGELFFCCSLVICGFDCVAAERHHDCFCHDSVHKKEKST